MLYYKNLFIIIVASLFIIGCSGDGSFDEASFDEAPPSSGESIEGGEHGPYGQTNWMNADYFWITNPSLASLTLPGTHDSGTSDYGAGWAPTAKCQEVNINKQVEWGVRFLDLRVSVDKKGVPGIYHGTAGYANRTLNQVLLGVRNFLHSYPSECVVLCFDYEYSKTAEASINAINGLLYSDSYRNYVYDKPEVPHLNDVRGKMIYWRRYGTWGVWPGLRVKFDSEAIFPLYPNAYLHIQDNYACSGSTKWEFIDRSLNNAMVFAGDISGILHLFISFTSYYNKIPAPWSDGPRMNKKVKESIIGRQRNNYNLPIHLGIIASDYVDSDYVHKVLCTNFVTNY